jgi:hypothetical protein
MRYRSIGWLGLLLACGDATDLVPPPTFLIVPAVQWSGGAVEIRSATFRRALPVVTTGGDSLVVARINDSTVAVTLPEGPSGSITLYRKGGSREALGEVQLVGLRSARVVPGTLGFEPLVPTGVVPLVFVAESLGTAGTDLAILDPATDQVSFLSGVGPVQTAFGVMPSYQENRFMVRGSTGQLGVWRLFPTPAFEYSSQVQNLGSRTVTQLNDSTWLTVTSNNLLVTRPSGTFSPDGGVSDPLRVVFSPSGHRVALVVSYSPIQQIPVLDAATGEAAFLLSLPSSQGIAFGVLADRLYLSSRQQSRPDTLVAVSASTGQFVAGAAFLPGTPGGCWLRTRSRIGCTRWRIRAESWWSSCTTPQLSPSRGVSPAPPAAATATTGARGWVSTPWAAVSTLLIRAVSSRLSPSTDCRRPQGYAFPVSRARPGGAFLGPSRFPRSGFGLATVPPEWVDSREVSSHTPRT